ncbi:MAG: tetratricopeptide repeat protein [Bacteroidota bacterium]
MGDFIGAYFNTYYNARRAFSEAEAELLTQQTADPRNERPYLAPFTVPPGAKTKFLSVIEKGSKLLQYHPESGLVEETLLMIGKSYYYQNENQQAERKFRELIEGYPESDGAAEARLLLANIAYKLNDREEAGSRARQLLEGEQTPRADVLHGAALLVATLRKDAGDVRGAADMYRTAAGHAPSSEERAVAFLRAGEMCFRLEDFTGAQAAYEEARGASATYASEYRAMMGMARSGVHLGRHQESRDLLEEMLGNQNNREFFGEIDLELARVDRDAGLTEEAVAQYRYVDTAYARTEASASAAYELGRMYETILLMYDSARTAYNRGKLHFPQAAVTPLLAERSEVMNRYFLLRAELGAQDSLRALILFPDSMLAALAALTRDSTADSTASRDVAGDSLGTAPGTSDPAPGDSGTTGGSSAAAPAAPDSLGSGRLPLVSVPLDTVEARRGSITAEMGALFTTGLTVNDSARAWYGRLLAEFPRHPAAPRALYVLARIEEQDSSSGWSARADSLYRLVVERFPDSEFAGAARRALGLPPPPAVPDPAMAAYAEAESLLLVPDLAGALEGFRRVVLHHPDSPVAPKARYAMGWVFEEMGNRPDSAEAAYQALVAAYPSSDFARKVKPRLDAMELARKAEAAPADSGASVPPGAAPPPGAPPGTGPGGKEMPPPPGAGEPDEGEGGDRVPPAPAEPPREEELPPEQEETPPPEGGGGGSGP